MRIGNSSDSGELACRAIRIGVAVANDSRESRCESPVPLGCHLNGKLGDDVKCWDPARPLEESPGPFGPGIPEKSPKESPGLPAPRSKKCPKQSRKSLRSLKTVFFETPETLPRLSQVIFFVSPCFLNVSEYCQIEIFT